MDQRIKTDFIALLRYGGLKQTIGALHDHGEGSYCCLGVLCEMAVAEGVVTKDNELYRSVVDIDDYSSAVLPYNVMKWAGVDLSSGRVLNTTLLDLNDGGATFPEIADIIEEHL